jgi:hypothetical protein
MIKLYSSSHNWFAWRPVRLGFVPHGPVVWLQRVRRCTIGKYRFYEAL